MPLRAHCFLLVILTCKVRQTDFLLWDQGSLVGRCIQGYASLCAAITICGTLLGPKFFTLLLPRKVVHIRGESVSWCIYVSCTDDANFVTVGH